MKSKEISIYVRNKDITPSSYYRIVQYAKYFDGNVSIREIVPKNLYERYLNFDKKKKVSYLIICIVYYMVMLFRATYYLLIDYIRQPHYLIVSKTFCPRYSPIFLRILIKKVSKKSILYWDFDDYIFESGEISQTQSSILEKKSKAIIVTSNFLKSKISSKYQNKVFLLPTTDGDMQGFDKACLIQQRKSTFNNEIRLAWVATRGNIPNLMKIIDILDMTAAKLKREYDKQLILNVVCNKSVEVKVSYLKIRNIKWTRERAKEEIYNAHIGIMPLILNEYSLGKGGFKLVQYISTGLPVIASNVGFNQEVIDGSSGILVDDEKCTDGWVDAILKICNSEDVWEKYSIDAYKTWNEKFSFERNLAFWKDLLSYKTLER